MKQIGNYTVEDIPIGSGGMGQVLKGTSLDGSRNVAIKEILPAFVQDVEYRARIESEISFLKKLDNENIVKVYDHFEIGGSLFIVMELVDGLNVEQHVAKYGAIPWQDAAKYMINILQTLQYVHEHGIVHRDIKPGNIMIRDNGQICLLDFGVAKDISQVPGSVKRQTVLGTVIGTDGYMSPEQASGLSIDQRSDVYALGCVFYFMLTGEHAFGSALSELDIHNAIVSGNFPRLSSKVKGLPASLQKVLDHAVDKNMLARFQSCREFAAELAKVLPGGTLINTGINSDIITVSVGRENCDICVGPQNYKVSRHHADIRLKQFTGGEFFVYTDCSSNGTLINGQMLRKGMTYNIPRGDNPEILLAGDPTCRLDITEVAHALDMQRASRIEAGNSADSGNNVQAGAHGGNELASGYGPQPGYGVQPGYRPASDPSDSLFGAVKNCLKKYADFSGRASRAEYWWFYLFNVILNTIVALVYILTDFTPEVLIASSVIALVMFLPSLSVFIRRMHDIGKGWGQLFLPMIPVAGIFFAVRTFIYLLKAGDPGPNAYGNSPVRPAGFNTVNMRPQQDPLSSIY